MKKSRPFLSFLCLFFGLHFLVAGAAAALVFVPHLGGLSAYGALLSEEDYQQTTSFRQAIEDNLYTAVKLAISEGEEKTLEPWENYAMQESPNLLYYICYDGREIACSEGETFPVTDGAPAFSGDYNFLLHFDGETVSLTKDGEAIDFYGNGYFTQDSLWNLPGYQNREDTRFANIQEEELSRCSVWLAARKEIIEVPGYDPLAWIPAQRRLLREQLGVWFAVAALSIVLLTAYCLRKDSRERFWAGAARWTGKIWFEWKLLVFLASLGACLVGVFAVFLYPWDSSAWPVLIVTGDLFFWILLFFVNDARRNPGARHHSAVAAFRRFLARRRALLPFQKRILRYGPGVLCGALCYLFLLLLLLLAMHEVFILPAIPLTILFLYLWSRARRTFSRTVEETGALIDRIGAISRGENLPPLRLSSDSDLAASANQLNTIESGVRAAVERQVKSERMKVELISNVSHDLKTPLTSIISYAQLLLEEDLPPAARDYAQILAQKADRLSHMVQDVFDVSKAASGNLKMQREQLDLVRLIRQTLADMGEALDASTLSFRVSLSPEPVFICADGQKLYRVFQNLLENVLRYSLENTRVYLRQECGGGQTAVTIKNVSREELPASVDLTERFVRGDESRTDGGSGLGLSIAKSFTQACGGNFSVETDGDLFTVRLSFPTLTPVVPPDAPSAENAAENISSEEDCAAAGETQQPAADDGRPAPDGPAASPDKGEKPGAAADVPDGESPRRQRIP